jgi:hypothetical protein
MVIVCSLHNLYCHALTVHCHCRHCPDPHTLTAHGHCRSLRHPCYHTLTVHCRYCPLALTAHGHCRSLHHPYCHTLVTRHCHRRLSTHSHFPYAWSLSITAPSILPHTHCPLSVLSTLSTYVHSHSTRTRCPLSLSTLSTHSHCPWSLSITAPSILPHTKCSLSLSTLSTHSHCPWSLCDHCTIHTATHSLSNVIVDTVHTLSLPMVIV